MPSNYQTPSGTIAGYGNPYNTAPTLGGSDQYSLMNLLGYNGQVPASNSNGSVQGDSTFRLQQAPALPGGSGGTGTPDDLAFLADQANQLKALLGRTDTGLSQGLTQNEDQYATAVGGVNTNKAKQVQDQNLGKQSAYDTIDQNAGTGYRSLAQIIGRAAGTGSSAFRDLLPNIIGKDTSSKRKSATDTYGRNLSNIDTSTNATLADLLKQKKANEQTLRTGIETQRQGIQGQLATNAGQAAQAKGGGFAAVKAAQSPFQSAIDNSRNAVESFFNQFRTPYAAPTTTPDLNAYNVDRATVNAGNSGAPEDASNPYAALLKRKLQAA